MNNYFYQMLDMWQDYFDNDIKVKDHCNITGKYRDFAHGDCNIDLKLNHKIYDVFTT